MIEISVIMPVYNGQSYLREAIQSVLTQSFADFEFIIINDGSTDSGADIINEFARTDSRVIFLDRKENKKLPYTLNEGLKTAQGKYIVRMDCDDICTPDRFERQFRFMEANPDIYILGSGYRTFGIEGQSKNIVHPGNSIVLAYRFISDTYFCHPSVILRRELISKIGYYKEAEAEDFDFFSRIIRVYKGANLPAVLLNYRESESNRSNMAKDRIMNSSISIFQENFKHYGGMASYQSDFYDFHKWTRIRISTLPVMLIISAKILNRIRRNYQYSFFSGVFIKAAWYLMYNFLLSVFKKLTRRK